MADLDEMFPEAEEPRPLVAFAFSLIGGILILADGVLLLSAAGVATDIGAPGAAQILSGLGGLGVLFGIVVTLLALGLFAYPSSHAGFGVAILVFSLVSIIGGGGFIIGLILGIIGGILGILFVDEPNAVPVPGHAGSNGPGESCSNCGTLILPGESHCSYCRAPVRPAASSPSGPNELGPSGTAPTRTASPSGGSLSTSPRPFIGCVECGEIQPTGTATACRRCGAALRRT